MMTTVMMKMTKKMRMMSECRVAHAAHLFSKVASKGYVIQQWVKSLSHLSLSQNILETLLNVSQNGLFLS